MNIHIHTFGCKLNQYESKKITSELQSLGFNITDIENANAIAINTCTVTKDSDNKLKLYVENIKSNAKEKIIFLIGCYVSKSGFNNIFGDNVYTISNAEKENATEIIYKTLLNKEDAKKENKIFFNQDTSRAYLKIQDGCTVFCSYCIVSKVRGPRKSVEPKTIYEAIKEASENGFREVVLTGLNLGSYQYNDINFYSLLSNILEKASKENVRIRLSSIEPIYFDSNLIKLFNKNNAKILSPSAHIPMQSGSNKILELMNRRYNREFYQNIIEKLYKENSDISLITDVMVGFPTETEKDFADTFSLCEESKFLKLHIFRYSDREGTQSYNIEEKTPSRIKLKRAKILNTLNYKMRDEYYNKSIGKELDVVVETILGNKKYEGTSGEYLKVIFNSEKELRKKELVSVFAKSCNKKNIIGYEVIIKTISN